MKKLISALQFLQQKIFKLVRYGILPVFQVFGHDIRTIFKNLSVMIVMVGLSILPSLYAWINIYACWDPYANTGNLPIAIINNDQGTVFNGRPVNVGNNIIDELKKNKSIGWEFVDDWQGNYGLNEGRYYALIEIPQNFSSGMVSLASTTPQRPAITYRVNEKLNAIAAKIANAAKTKLVNSIQTTFVKTVNEEAIKALKSESQKSNLSTSRLKEIKATFTQADSDIAQLRQYIGEANTQSESFQKYLNQSVATLPRITEQINSLEKITEANKSLALRTRQTVESVASDLNGDVAQLQELNRENQELLEKLKNVNGNSINQDVLGTMKQCSSLCDSLHIILTTDRSNLRTLNKSYNLSSLSFLEDSLDYMDSLVVNEKTALDKTAPLIRSDTSKGAVSSALGDLSRLSDEITSESRSLSDAFYSKGSPVLNSMVNNLSTQLEDSSGVIELSKTVVPQLNALAVFGGAGSRLSVQQANKLNVMLGTLRSDLNQLLDKMNQITSQNIDKLVDLAENHPSEIADFISSPIDVREVDVYDVGTFGVGLTPFYTVLAIWVGALLACALLSVECEDMIDGVRLNLKQKHFGKMLLFLCLSLIQSTIITLGDVFLLGVKPADLGLMLGFSAISSITFTIMIFTLCSIFGNVGKAIAVVIMVFQIAGAGGIYPIQTNPKIFGFLQPLWPFTYAINGYREAIAGPVWSSVFYNIRSLLCFAGVFLLLAVLKKPFHQINKAMEHKFKEAEL